MKKVLFFIASCWLCFACKHEKQVTHPGDYNVFLKPEFLQKQLSRINEEINFWQKRLDADTGSFGNMLELGYHFLHRFKTTGSIRDLKLADSLFLRSSQKLNETEPNIFYTLSQNAITQHRFKNAYKYCVQGEKQNGSPYVARLLSFDALMELGMYKQALASIEQLRDKTSFDYLIRKAKYEDHAGRPEAAIKLMEQAMEKCDSRKNSGAYKWLRSNLADMYGHANRIKKAYEGYLDVLKVDSANLYCLKGIAWIVYSHEHNTKEAKRILNFILTQTNMPDVYLLLAEIEDFEGNHAMKQKYINLFLQGVNNKEYGAMYNKYLVHLYADELNEPQKAIDIAKEEIASRPTPETYSWLAWSKYKNAEPAEAMEIIKNNVEGFTYEPATLMKVATIYAANGESGKAKQIFKKCLKSSFELGPVATKSIEDAIDAME